MMMVTVSRQASYYDLTKGTEKQSQTWSHIYLKQNTGFSGYHAWQLSHYIFITDHFSGIL